MGIKFIYENTSTGSPLRLLITQYCACYLIPSKYAANPSDFPPEMLIDLVTALADRPTTTLRFPRPERDLTRYEVEES